MKRDEFAKELFKLKHVYENAFPYSFLYINLLESDRHYISITVSFDGDNTSKRYIFESVNELSLWIDDKILYSKLNGINIVWR